MIRRPPRSTPFPTRRSSDLARRQPLVDLPELLLEIQARTGFASEFAHISEGRSRRQSQDRKSTRLNSSHQIISYAVFCLKKKKKINCSSHANRRPACVSTAI